MTKIVRIDAELEMPRVDQVLRDTGATLVLLPGVADADALASELRDADLLLTCYAQISSAAIAGASRLRGIVKYGVGIDAIDIVAARARRIPVGCRCWDSIPTSIATRWRAEMSRSATISERCFLAATSSPCTPC